LLRITGALDKDKTLTEREFQCLELYGLGKSAEKTGEILNISRRTVETHFNNIKTKLNVSSKSELTTVLS
jgi:DNA-binding CsgD family transcriptional regulator